MEVQGIPDNPSAWLFRVAKNKAIDVIRRNKFSIQFDFTEGERRLLTSGYTMSGTMDTLWKEELIDDDMLRMMFACCRPEISAEGQITLILKTLCGFSTAEIAKAFLTSEENVTKRLYRTKEFFRENKTKLEIPSVDELKSRTNVVLNSIYLLFNEGYNSTDADQLIREDLIDEAMLLCKLLTENKHTQLSEVFALMALMCFHSARSSSRLTTEGEIILLPYQDRSKWNMELVNRGNEYMNKAAFGKEISTYHLEAAISYEHCIAPDFSQTNWPQILKLYEWLCALSSSPVSELNKIVAILHVHGPEIALSMLNNMAEKKKLEKYYLYHSLLGEIYSQLTEYAKAQSAYEEAIHLTRSETEKKC
ncbi:MAG: RNA polymerase subunit sigma-24 [Bacteroidetes bacterium]|nr:RNA polymerase subunit sigma-24 [Bacteroidota bacterium]